MMSVSVIADVRKAAVEILKASPVTICDLVIDADHVFDSPEYALSDPDDIPALVVYVSSVKSEKRTLNSQCYLKDYQLVVGAIVNAADDTDLADAVADAEHVVDTLLLSDCVWVRTAGAQSIEQEGAVFVRNVPSEYRTARVDIGYTIKVPAEYAPTSTPIAGDTVRVEISPKPKTTAGWEEKAT